MRRCRNWTHGGSQGTATCCLDREALSYVFDFWKMDFHKGFVCVGLALGSQSEEGHSAWADEEGIAS